MTLEDILNQLPEYARDMKHNLNRVMTPKGAPGLSEREIAALMVAGALAASSKSLQKATENFALEYLSQTEIDGAKTAHAIMSMTNIYYRFLHTLENTEYQRMPSGLRRLSEKDPGIDPICFHLSALAVSSINHCKVCMDYHERKLKKLEVSAEAIQSAVRIASVMNAVGEVLKFIE